MYNLHTGFGVNFDMDTRTKTVINTRFIRYKLTTLSQICLHVFFFTTRYMT